MKGNIFNNYSTGINDRISFKKFLGLPLDKPSSDHPTFRFQEPPGHRLFPGFVTDYQKEIKDTLENLTKPFSILIK